MDNKFQTSFIPKKPLAAGSSRPARHHSWFSLISGVILFIAILLAAGVFGWKLYIQKQIKSLKADTEEAKATFDPSLLDQLERLDNRIETSKKLLNEHLAFSAFFDALAGITLKNVGFTSFSYVQSGTKVMVTMEGEAESFSTLALQSDALLAADAILSNATLSNVQLQKNGHVTFSTSFTVNPSLISYRKNMVIVPEETGSLPGTTTAPVASTTVNRAASSTQ